MTRRRASSAPSLRRTTSPKLTVTVAAKGAGADPRGLVHPGRHLCKFFAQADVMKKKIQRHRRMEGRNPSGRKPWRSCAGSVRSKGPGRKKGRESRSEQKKPLLGRTPPMDPARRAEPPRLVPAARTKGCLSRGRTARRGRRKMQEGTRAGQDQPETWEEETKLPRTPRFHETRPRRHARRC